MIAAWIASGLIMVWALVHTIVGGRQVAGPLRRDAALPEVVRTTAWMCWHMVTATLFLTAVLFAWGAASARPDLLLAGTLISAGVMAAGLIAAPVLGVSYGRLPQGWLFVPVVVCGLWAVWG
ncbi:MAG: hypothetical protein AAGF30_03805 [Pseudomonadota bacterium]